MVKVHNGTGTEIEIDTGTKLLNSVPPNGYYDVECAGCIPLNIYISHPKSIWQGKIPCTTDNTIEITDGIMGIQVHFGETTLPATRSGQWSMIWWIFPIIIILCILWYISAM